MTGRIVKIISNQYTVQAGANTFLCQARGKFRHHKTTLLVGDEVEFDVETKLITEIKPRFNQFLRPPVANIYDAIVVASLKKPDLDLYLLDKMLIMLENKCPEIIILFTKLDLCNAEEKKAAQALKKYYADLNYPVYFNNKSELALVKKKLKGKLVTLTGQSGAGKSTFLNALKPELELLTSPISEALNRGVHTTRHTEIYEIDGISFVDTPGFSALNLDLTQEQLKANFREFKNLKCKYQDCNHDRENDCLVKQNVQNKVILSSRYENYLLFKKEIYENSRKLYK